MKLRSIAIAVAAVSMIAAAVCVGGLRVNTTSSLPKGFYAIVDAPLQVGSVVLVCPPPSRVSEEARARGYVGFSADCPEQFQRLIKRVVGTPGMTISTSENGLLVIDGRAQPSSSVKPMDKAGRPLTAFFTRPATLGNSQYLVLGDTEKSFDSRYFGPVEQGSIRAVMQPVFTF